MLLLTVSFPTRKIDTAVRRLTCPKRFRARPTRPGVGRVITQLAPTPLCLRGDTHFVGGALCAPSSRVIGFTARVGGSAYLRSL